MLHESLRENVPNLCWREEYGLVTVKTLDLNRDFSEIVAQLNAIVAEHFA